MSNKKCLKKVFISMLVTVSLMCNRVYAMNADYGIGKSIFKLFSYTAIFVLVIIVAIYGTKFIAKNSKKFASSKYMKIIDVLNIDVNTKIAMIEINNKLYVFAVNNNNIEIIDEFSKEDLKTNIDLDFDEQLEKYKDRYICDKNIFSNLRQKINNLTSKEDEDNEKKC